jgi:uncharacterized membrane protein YphA (DoxX/SURF4 family)
MVRRHVPGSWIAGLRILVGFSWLAAAYEKIVDPAYATAVLRPTLETWAAHAQPPVASFIAGMLLPNIDELSFALKAVEVLIGISLVFGVLSRFGAFAGFVIIAAAWVFRDGFEQLGGYAGADFIVMATMLFLALAPAARVWSIDAVLFRPRTVVISSPPPPVATPVEPRSGIPTA